MNKSSSCSSVILKPQRFTESQTYRWNHRSSSLHQSSSALMFLHCAPIPRSPSAKQSLHRQDIQCFHLTHGGFQKSMDWQIEGDTWKFHYKNLQPLICIVCHKFLRRFSSQRGLIRSRWRKQTRCVRLRSLQTSLVTVQCYTLLWLVPLVGVK